MSQMEEPEHLNVEHIRKLHRWRMAFFGAVILLAGVVIGGSAAMILLPHRLLTPPPGPEFESLRMMPSLRRDLGLSPEQSARIAPILEKYMKQLAEIRMQARAEIVQTLDQMNEDISKVLTDRQERIWQHGLDRLERGVRPGPGGRGRRGQGPGGMRQRRGPGRRGMGPYGPRRGPAGPNTPEGRAKPDTNQMDVIPTPNSGP
jgi:hypothetical protein